MSIEIEKDYRDKIISQIVQKNDYSIDIYFTDGSHLEVYAWGDDENYLGFDEDEG